MWQKIYKQKKFYWGLKPYPLLLKYIDKIPSGNALDIGCGEGRNSIFLESHGFNVDAIDNEKEAIKKLKKYIKEKNIKNIKPQLININNFKFKNNKYTIVTSFHVLDFLKLSEIEKLIKKLKKSVKKKGYLLFSVFSTKEPAYHKITKVLKRKPIEKNTFFLPKLNIYRHFFTKKELQHYFKDWKIIFLKQREKEDKHGREGKHYHNIIEIVAQKKG